MAQDNVQVSAPVAAGRADPRKLISRALKSTRRHSFRTGMVLGAIVAVAVVFMVIQNGESAQLDWTVFHFRAPLWIILFLTAAAGAVVWELIKAASRRARRLRAERREAVRAAQDANSGA